MEKNRSWEENERPALSDCPSCEEVHRIQQYKVYGRGWEQNNYSEKVGTSNETGGLTGICTALQWTPTVWRHLERQFKFKKKVCSEDFIKLFFRAYSDSMGFELEVSKSADSLRGTLPGQLYSWWEEGHGLPGCLN